MTSTSSFSKRFAHAALGAGRPACRPPTAGQQRTLPLSRRLLAALLGIRVRPDLARSSAASTVRIPSGTAVPGLSDRMPSEGVGPEEPAQPTAPSPPPGRAERRPRPRARRGSVPLHLLSEDRYEYERILDEALLSVPHRPELAAVGQRLNTEQLRLMALNAKIGRAHV